MNNTYPLSQRLRPALLAVALLLAPALAQAQAQAKPNLAPWPTKALKIIVGFPAGSTPDLVARTIAAPLSKALGQPVLVENRVGAGGNVAADAVAKATDDHTIGVLINGNLTIAKILNPRLPFDPATDFAPIGLIATAPLVLAVPADAPGGDAKAFFDAARAAGDKWSYGSVGVGSIGHIGTELLKAKTKVNPVHIPYAGNPQVITALIGGQVHMSLLPPGLAAAQVRAGKLRAIAVTSSGRSPLAPELPSLSEIGVTGIQLEIWNAVAAPASMPKHVVAKLSALVSEIVRSPEIRPQLFQQGWQVVGANAEGLANRIKSDTAMLSAVIQAQGIKLE